MATTAPIGRERLPGLARSIPLANVIRLVTFVSLAIFCGQAWAGLVGPSASGTMIAVVVIAVVLAWALAVAERRRSRLQRSAALALLAGLGTAAILVTCGASPALVRPDRWGSLVSQIGGGLGGLPSLRVPYRGADQWIRIVILAGGGLIVTAAAALALGTGRRAARPVAATIVLAVVYAVPVVEVGPRAPYVDGAIFAILAAAAMWGDRLRRDQAGPASVMLGACVLGAMAIGPRLNAGQPWIDYQHLADRLAPSAASFDWDHRYGPLNWSRSGRVMLRVSAPSSGYWKGVVLDKFDGLRWVGLLDLDHPPDTQVARPRKDWFQTVRVVAGDISSHQLYAPGDIVAIHHATLNTLPVGGGTLLAARRPLKRGDSYTADVYSPRPSVTDLQGAGDAYPQLALDHLQILLPQRLGGPPTIDPHTGRVTSLAASAIVFRAWGQSGSPSRMTAEGALYADAAKYLGHSVYAREWALARRLRAQSTSPYDLVRRIYARVRQGAHYDETPPPARVPLDDFLFGHRAGYCQQFSGAMALLLRMGGIPARVASGFAPGVYDRGSHQYVVRDLDAHSWVEVYFPRIGWVPFDPTPTSSPASSQAAGDRAVTAATGDSHDHGSGAAPATAAGSGASGVLRWWVIVLALSALGVGMAVLRRLREQGRCYADAPPELAELVRALHRSGRPPPPQLTLAALESSFRGSAHAQGYLRTLRDARFAGRPGRPTFAQRTGLRNDLGEGLGRRGRLRALWSIPPSPRARLAELRRRLRARFYPE